MKFDIQKAIEESTQDGNLDAKKLMGLIDNQYVNPIVAKNKPDLDKVKDEAKQDWIKSLGFDGVETESQLKAYVKKTSDEVKEEYATLKTNFDELKAKNEELTNNYQSTSNKLNEYERKSLLTKDNFNGDVDYAMFKINQNVGDDVKWEDAYNQFKEDNPTYFAENKVPSTTGVKHGKTNPNDKDDWELILKERHPELEI